MATPEKYSHIKFVPPSGVRREAEYGLKLRREHGRGGTAVGIARARDLSNGKEVSPSTVRRMKAFFDRHASDAKAEGFTPGDKGFPSNGKIANLLWGGPSGYSWAKKVVEQMNAADERSYSPDTETRSIDGKEIAMQNVERRYLAASGSENATEGTLGIEHRADPQTGERRTYLIGYAAKFNTDSLLLGDFVERIAPSAFGIVENGEDLEGKPLETRGLFNHDPNHLIGRFPNTMKLTVDKIGLKYEILLPASRKDLEEMVSRGDLKGSSFSFIVAEGGEKWTREGGKSRRLVTKIKSLLDCGPVTYPAYRDSSVAVAKRSYEQFASVADAPKVDFKEEMRKLREFYSERRGFCPTGDGGGVDNSCGKGGDGKSNGGEGKKPSGDKKPPLPSGQLAGYKSPPKMGYDKGIAGDKPDLAKKYGFGGGAAGDKPDLGAKYGFNGGVSGGKYKEWKKGDHLDKAKENDTQEFLDKARDEQLSKGGKDKGKADEGGGVQTWSKGDNFPWTTKQVGDKDGYLQGVHPDGSKTDKYPFKDGNTSEAEKQLAAELKKNGKKSSRDRYADLISWCESRGFCPTGPGGGVDNSCGGKGEGGQKPLDANDPSAVKSFLEKMARETGMDLQGRPAPQAKDTAVGGSKPLTPAGGTKTLEQIRLEAAGVWEGQQQAKKDAQHAAKIEKGRQFHDKIDPLKDALRQNGGSWSRFASELNRVARETKGLTKGRIKEAAAKAFQEGPDAFRKFLDDHKIGQWPKAYWGRSGRPELKRSIDPRQVIEDTLRFLKDRR